MSDPIAPLAQCLLQCRTGEAIKRFRRSLDKETANKVINHPSITPIDRVAISLALRLGGVDRWGRGDSEIYTQDDITPWDDDHPPQPFTPR
jgi:hypothetical protein